MFEERIKSVHHLHLKVSKMSTKFILNSRTTEKNRYTQQTTPPRTTNNFILSEQLLTELLTQRNIFQRRLISPVALEIKFF